MSGSGTIQAGKDDLEVDIYAPYSINHDTSLFYNVTISDNLISLASSDVEGEVELLSSAVTYSTCGCYYCQVKQGNRGEGIRRYSSLRKKIWAEGERG